MSEVIGSQIMEWDEPHVLRSGETLTKLRLAYEMHGTANSDHSNIVLIHHALSPSHHVAKTEANPKKGWWEKIVGPGKAIDTEQYCVICINNLGSCYGSTGPESIDFPVITMQDMVDTQIKLLDKLGFDAPVTVIGNSMGAMLSLQMAIDYPDRVKKFMSTSSAYKAYASNVINRSIQRRMISIDLDRWDEVEHGGELVGFNLARELGYFTYRHPSNLNEKFSDHKKLLAEISEVESYFAYNAKKFTKKFNPFSYLCMLDAMDLFDVTEPYADPLEAFRKITAQAVVVSVDSDFLFTPAQQQELFQYLSAADVDVRFIQHHSEYGHDAFLVDTEAFTQYLTDFL